jgi:hypothetical protein
VTTRLIAAIATLLIGSLITGLAHIALLPPFEGFDETGHYAYIQQVAKTGRWPVRGDKMSKDIDEYLKIAPTTASMQGPWTYQSFFSSQRDVVDRGRQFIQDRPSAPRGFSPGIVGNWQAQHPPLYYFLMAPAYLVSDGWSLAAQLFFLRGLSYLIAWGGLCIAAIAMLRRAAQDFPTATLLPFGIALWPAIFPMWFPEMGRLGNDSLITVFAACTVVAVWRLSSRDSYSDHVLLGIILGLALLTKATFLPVAAATFVLLAIRGFFVRNEPDRMMRCIKGLLICGAVAVLVSGWWYVAKYVETGSFIGSNDDTNLKAAGGLLAALKQNLDLSNLVRAPWSIVGSFLWASTWSFVLPPRTTVLPLALFGLVVACGTWLHFRRATIREVDGLALLSLGFFTAAIVQHSLVLLAMIGNPAPAWYLHSIAPILALFVGYGIANAASATWLRRFTTSLALYAPCFLLGATALNLLFFAGCGPLMPGRQYFSATDGARCLADLPRMYDNLAVLALPGIGLVLFVAGWSLLLAGVIAAARYLPRLPHTSITSTR